jgi:hypothetical protein
MMKCFLYVFFCKQTELFIRDDKTIRITNVIFNEGNK